MANYPNTGSTLVSPNGKNKTSVALSTNIIIKVNDTAIGAIQKLSITEAGGIKPIDEVGTDGHVDMVRNKSVDVNGDCERIRFDGLRITEAFSRGFVHVKSQIYPFDIVILDRNRRAESQYVTTVIKNVWIKSMTYSYTVGEWVLSDSFQWEAETIYSFLGGNGKIPIVGQSFRTDVKHMVSPDNIEQETDIGSNNRRGSLDAGGLIDIGSTGDLW